MLHLQPQAEEVAKQLNTLPENIDEYVCDLIFEVERGREQAISDDAISTLVGKLAYCFFTLALPLRPTPYLFRGRRHKRNGSLFANQSALSYPKTGASLGRANKKDSPAVYMSYAPETVFEEIKLPAQAVATMAKHVLKTETVDFNVIPIGLLNEYRCNGRTHFPAYDPLLEFGLSRLRDDVRRAVHLVDSFFADYFRRKNDERDNYVYRVTSTISHEFFSENAGVSGLLYPSVSLYGGWNIAIRPTAFDKNFDLAELQCIKLDKKFGYGINRICPPLAIATELSNDGKVAWLLNPNVANSFFGVCDKEEEIIPCEFRTTFR
jgi:RES domain-containing protein